MLAGMDCREFLMEDLRRRATRVDVPIGGRIRGRDV